MGHPPVASPRFANSAVMAAPSFFKSLTAGMGSAGGFLAPISNVMSKLEADQITGLLVSDVGGMVVPRSGVELIKRGPIPAGEALFREFTGSVSNTFLAGWMGIAAALGFKMLYANPKGMDYKSWIDSRSMESFGNITKELLKRGDVKTAEDLQRKFLETVMGRLQGGDNVWKLPQYAEVFKGLNNGRMNEGSIKHIVDRMLGSVKDGHHIFNVDEAVARQLQRHEYRHEINSALSAIEQKFMEKRGTETLTKAQKFLLNSEKALAESKLLKSQHLEVRSQIISKLRSEEKRFIEGITKYMTTHGKLCDEVFLLGADGKRLEGLGLLNAQDMVKKATYFMREFLQRAITSNETGLATKTLNKEAVWLKLFGKSGKSWIQRNILPHINDGLLTYAYKSKYFLVLAPIAATVALGCSMVYINNALTRRKTGGNAFPGEEALKAQAARGGH